MERTVYYVQEDAKIKGYYTIIAATIKNPICDVTDRDIKRINGNQFYNTFKEARHEAMRGIMLTLIEQPELAKEWPDNIKEQLESRLHKVLSNSLTPGQAQGIDLGTLKGNA